MTTATALQNEIAAHMDFAAVAAALGLASKRTIAKHKAHAKACMARLNEIDPVPAEIASMTDDDLMAELSDFFA